MSNLYKFFASGQLVKRGRWIFLLTLLPFISGWAQPSFSEFTIARVRYGGGGDWYNDPSATRNMLQFFKSKFKIPCQEQEAKVSIMDEELHSYPFLFLTGHGQIRFAPKEVIRLRNYLQNGGFLYVDDDYGLDKSLRSQMAKVFPDAEFLEIPFSHPIYHIVYPFERGLPKIHEHDGGPPKGYGIFYKDRMVVFYTFNTNISDGWADPEVHDNPPQVRENALKMGLNIITFALTY